jgi:ribosomal-protein-alanine N-acetyltransferase
MLKAVAGGRIVGFVAGDPRRWSSHAVILTLGVDPTWRRKGVGQRLMRECEARLDLPVIRLQVRKSNTPAIALYRKLGYASVRDLPRYYSDEDGYLMEKARGGRERPPRSEEE